MSQLLRLHNSKRTFLTSVSYFMSLSGSVRRTLEQLQPCNKCQSIRLTASDGYLTAASRCRLYSSGVPQVKTESQKLMPKSKWKKKKTKTSKMNKKIYSDLLSVLNKRSVQMVLDREEQQLHRTLVTNFSFMDFPLLTSPDTSVVPEARTRPASDRSVQETESNRAAVDPWDSQFSSFHKQLGHVIGKSDPSKTRHGLDMQALSGKLSSVAHRSRKDVRKCDFSPNSEPPIISSAPRESMVDTSHKWTSDIPPHNTPSFSSDLGVLPPPHTELNHKPQADVHVPKHSDSVSSVPNVKRGTRPSVNANILNTKVAEKPSRHGRTAMRPLFAEAATLPLEYDTLPEEEEAEETVSEVENPVADSAIVAQVPTRAEIRRQQKAKSDMEKFQSDPAKFNHVFNQELLAYVDACCFAGLESTAHYFLNVFHHRNASDSTISPKQKLRKKTFSMHQILDIGVYNRLMRAWARKSQWARIEQLLNMLRTDGLTPNLQSYAACLECLGRQRSMDVATGEKLLADLEREGLDVKEVFNKCTFFRDEQHFVSKALKTLDPEYQPSPPVKPFSPSGPLVDGLAAVRQEDQVAERNPYAGIISTSELQTLAQTQLQRELRGSVSFKSVLKQPSLSKRTVDCRRKLEEVREDWKGLLTKAVERKVRYLARRSKVDYNLTLYPYLKLFEPQEYVQCLLQEIEALASSSETFSPNKMYLWKQLSGRIQQKFLMVEKIRSKLPKKVSHLYKDYADRYNDASLDLDSHRQQWQELVARSMEGPSLDLPPKIWPNHILLALGKLLYDLILYDLKVDANILKAHHTEKKMVPAFYTIYRNYAYQIFEEIKPHPVLLQLYKGAELTELTFDAGLLPMLVPPIPWVSTSHGGYLLNSVNLVRLPISAQAVTERSCDQEAVVPSQLSGVLDSINTLSACAWTINKVVLDVMIHIFNKKGDASLDIPPPASECPAPPKITPGMSAQEKSQVQKQRQKLSQQRAEMHSLWCTELYKLSIANKFRDDVLWFPHNLDFRGRTYPCPPHFNHLGSDVTRSILLFAKGKPLGPQGLDWMKIHLINLTGFKKRCSNRERLAYANEMMPEILDSADRPLEGNKWWQKSDEPWQTLACCMEIAKATRCQDPAQYVCHLPVHQDGSCNGLQHYAALGRDKAGAQSVNLWPYDHPQDVYSDVCELVERERQKDAAEGIAIAKTLEGFVRRKVIKQTVMTTVYGVTRFGAKAQILRQLKDIPDFPQTHVWAGSRYLTEKTFQCLNEMFSATKDIQDWLTLSAQLIATICQRPVEWVTPLGLPVVQPYHKALTTTRFGVNSVDRWNQFEKPNAMKQKNAFPPNYIHSLDSTHMMLTALYCMRAGITFVSVHDCFWTHACDVETMNRICREQFVALHKQPLLEDLSNQLLQTYTPVSDSHEGEETSVAKLRSVLANVPARGDFDLDRVLESTYFFS